MGRDDWFRRQTWAAHDAEDFQQRLRRSRGNASKAQYLRIQAVHLAKVGLHAAALSLLSQLLRDFPEPSELASTHLHRAQSFVALQDFESAIKSFRAALVAEEANPGRWPGTPLEFAWFIVSREQTDLYSEVEPLLLRHEREGGATFPIARFKGAAARAIVADSDDRLMDARRYAAEAREAAKEQHSGLRYHPDIGLVVSVPPDISQRLEAIGE